MPNSRRLVAAVATATVALPLTTVLLATPAVAAQIAGTAHGYRWQSSSTSPTDSYDPYGGPSYGQPYGGYGGPSYGSPFPGQGSGQGFGQQSTTTSTAGLDSSAASQTQVSGLVRVATVVDYGEGEAAGTGIVLSGDGIVVTNHHVVEGATSIEVTDMSTGTKYTADLVGSSTRKDVAVLQLENAAGLTTATTENRAVTVGEAVTAVGDANGNSTLSAAPGTVTSLRQSITVSDDETTAKHRLRSLIEVSSDVIPGDSGGALRDADGDVVGMTVAASSGTTSATVDGYVIPWSRVLRVEQAVLAGETTGDIELGYSPFLGVELDGSTGSTTIAGVVSDGPAEAAGLAAGDTVTALDGVPVSSAKALRAAVATHAAGDSISVTWTDSTGTSHAADVTLTQAPIA